MYIAWPEELLQLPGFEEALDSSTGLPLFRGPRLRIGLSESWDSSLTNISPDHAGCATYTGARESTPAAGSTLHRCVHASPYATHTLHDGLLAVLCRRRASLQVAPSTARPASWTLRHTRVK